MKITIIKPKTSITMKPNSVKPAHPRCLFIRHRRTLSESGKALKCEQNLFMPNKPNFQQTMQTITLIMAGTYNENNHLSTQKSKPNTNPMQTQTKPNSNPIRTQSGFIPCIGLHIYFWMLILLPSGASCKCLLERYLEIEL
jgi:hypothetical protein